MCMPWSDTAADTFEMRWDASCASLARSWAAAWHAAFAMASPSAAAAATASDSHAAMSSAHTSYTMPAPSWWDASCLRASRCRTITCRGADKHALGLMACMPTQLSVDLGKDRAGAEVGGARTARPASCAQSLCRRSSATCMACMSTSCFMMHRAASTARPSLLAHIGLCAIQAGWPGTWPNLAAASGAAVLGGAKLAAEARRAWAWPVTRAS
mmetsp:Transcript_14345/g.38889  ORF Transcript_14345/g.38889 Transcript_14345/m.38889 type:complete len:213 (+) Transcript_14345:3267-3905(+)